MTLIETVTIAGTICAVTINAALWLNVLRLQRLHIERLRRIELAGWQPDN